MSGVCVCGGHSSHKRRDLTLPKRHNASMHVWLDHMTLYTTVNTVGEFLPQQQSPCWQIRS